MRKSLAECKDWVVIVYAEGMTPLESYKHLKDANHRVKCVKLRLPNTVINVLSKAYCVRLEREGALAWNKTTPY